MGFFMCNLLLSLLLRPLYPVEQKLGMFLYEQAVVAVMLLRLVQLQLLQIPRFL
jgi:hypothetical protein